jgi:HSP20 family protein
MSLLVRRNGNGLRRPFRSAVSDLFDNDDFFEGEFFNRASVPAVNVKETEDEFKIELAAPGIKKEDFKVDVENGILSISAENEDWNEEKEGGYTRKEFSYTSFNRSFTLPDSIDEDDIHAKYNEGVLTLTLAKKEAAKIQPVKAIAID